jgi:hypothetical protein
MSPTSAATPTLAVRILAPLEADADLVTLASVKRHSALVALSHEHHGLVQASRLRRAAEAGDPLTAARAFLGFFEQETVAHFREEEGGTRFGGQRGAWCAVPEHVAKVSRMASVSSRSRPAWSAISNCAAGTAWPDFPRASVRSWRHVSSGSRSLL